MERMATVDNRVKERHEMIKRMKDSRIVSIIDEYVMKVTKENEIKDSESAILRKAFCKFLEDLQLICEEKEE